MVVDVCRGLHFAHRMGVVHRDVKPANIRLTTDGTVKILDFGIAKSLRTEATDPNLTQQGMVLGTPSYLSPELVQGAKVDHHADMWAVGVILYEMLTGRRPFEAPTITSLIHKIVSEPPPPLDAAALRLPDGARRRGAAGARQGPGAPLRGPRRDGEGAAARDRRDTAAGAAARPAGQEARLRGELRRGATDARRGRPVGRARGRAARAVARPLPHRHRLADQGDRAAPAHRPRRCGGRPASRCPRRPRARPGRRSPRRPQRRRPPRRRPARPPRPRSRSRPGPLDTATLRARGASAFRELGTFGEPPATKEAALSPVADMFAVAGADGAIRLWDLRSRNRAALLRTDLHQRTRPRRRGAGTRLLARRVAARLRPRGRRRAPVGHVDGRRGAGQAPPRRVGRGARLLARRRDARDRLARREPASVRRGGGARGRGPARAAAPAHAA